MVLILNRTTSVVVYAVEVGYPLVDHEYSGLPTLVLIVWVMPDPIEATAVPTLLTVGAGGTVVLVGFISQVAMVISIQVGAGVDAVTVNVSVAFLPVSVVPTKTLPEVLV